LPTGAASRAPARRTRLGESEPAIDPLVTLSSGGFRRGRSPRREPALARPDADAGLRLGYACVNTQLPSSARTLRLANATPERLRELIAANLAALEAIVRWNHAAGIEVFRLTSNLIPFASHGVNGLPWWNEFGDRLDAIGELLRRATARVSTHPGQYTVLSSSRPEVVSAAVAELEYHNRLLTALGLDSSHKIVLHVGSGGAASRAAFARFLAGFERLSEATRQRLVLENDERWSLEEVLHFAESLGVPVVFDVFHHELAPSLRPRTVRELVLRAGATWRKHDGRQEVHFSTQQPGRRPGAHAETLDLEAFAAFINEVGDLPLDCVLEVKDKEQSVLRARELLRERA
jgi:UV DNA damage endonuclease